MLHDRNQSVACRFTLAISSIYDIIHKILEITDFSHLYLNCYMI